MTLPNDWEIRKCLAFCLGLLLAMLGLIGLASLGHDVPVLRQLAGFLFLTFVPGILLLRILKIHNVGIIESLLYSVGLSLAFVMATGVVANFALPPLGVSHPIALAPLTATFTVFFPILCFLAYARDKNFRPANPPHKDSEEVAKPGFGANLNPWLLAILLPLLAILGASLVNFYHNNILLFIFIFIVILIIGLVAFNKVIPARAYAFMIVMTAIALLYQTTFISSYLVGSDIHFEYYFAKLVVESGYWDATINNAVTACLSITMLAPVYSLLLNMDTVWLFKIIYPLFFCLVPLALFHIYRLQIDSRRAFFAAFFFIAMPMFFMDMAQLARQQVSELFFVLVILLMVDRKLTLTQRTILAIVFSLVASATYYGMGPLLTGYLIIGWLLTIFFKSRPGRTLWQWLAGKANSLPADLTSAGAFTKKAMFIVIGVFLVVTLAYYSVTASGQTIGGFRVLASIPKSTVEKVVQGVTTPPAVTPPAVTPPAVTPPAVTPPAVTPPAVTPPAVTPPAVELPGFIQNITARFPFLNPLIREPLARTAIGLDFPYVSLGGKIWRVFQYLVELCLIAGFIRLIFRPGGLGKFKIEYLSLALISCVILPGVYLFNTTSYGMGVSRVFHITLFFLAPLFLLGGQFIAYGIARLFVIFRKGFASLQLSFDNPVFLRFTVLVVLIPYFIFNSGVVFELSRSQTTSFIDTPYSIALSSYRVELTTVSNKQDIAAAEWILTVADEDYRICADHHVGWFGAQLAGKCLAGNRTLYSSFYRTKKIPSPSYIYFRTRNTQEQELAFTTSYGARQSISFDDLPWFTQAVGKSDRIYNNGSAQILLHP